MQTVNKELSTVKEKEDCFCCSHLAYGSTKNISNSSPNGNDAKATYSTFISSWYVVEFLNDAPTAVTCGP